MAARDVAKVMRCCVLSVCVRGVSVCWWVRLVTKSIRVPGEACNLVLLPPFLTFVHINSQGAVQVCGRLSILL